LKTEPFGFGATLTDEVANYLSSQPYLEEGTPGRPRNLPTNTHFFKVCNAFGLYDMHGNLKEWCLDNYGPYPNRSTSNPAGPSQGNERVVRGGSFRTFPWGCRSAARSHVPPDQRREDLGFRVAVPEQVPEMAK
jgi:formylglycine-generating enzyme required for sulfatase activity